MMRWTPPAAISPQGMIGLRGLAATPAPRSSSSAPAKSVPKTPTPVVDSSRQTSQAPAAGGFRPKPLARPTTPTTDPRNPDTYITRPAADVEQQLCADDPASPGRAKLCRIVDNALVRLAKDGPEYVSTMMKASERPDVLQAERNIAFSPNNIYGGGTGAMVDHYAALWTIRHFQELEPERVNDIKKPLIVKELLAILAQKSESSGDIAYDTKGLKESVRLSVERQLKDSDYYKELAAKEGEAKADQQRKADALKMETDAKIKEQSATASTTRLLLIGGGVLAAGLAAFVVLRRK